MNVVIDTNVLVSFAITPQAVAAKAVRNAFVFHTVLRSHETYTELCEVIMRPKFDKFLSLETREIFLEKYAAKTLPVRITERVHACCDQSDNKFLELAVCGKADVIITGDRDLLSLHPFRHVAILNPLGYGAA